MTGPVAAAVHASTSLETSPEIATADTLEVLAAIHRRYEADGADRLVECLRDALPDVDENRVNAAADWASAVDLAAVNAAARALLEPRLQEAFAQPNANRRRRDVARLMAAEKARLEERPGITLLEPAMRILESPV